tara:strand:+ start:160 stop:789 length:630 start_codon:yes stop_codon:yes gene_type:complete
MDTTIKNVLNSGTIEALTPKSSLLVEAIKTKNPNKVQLHFAEKKGSSSNSLVARLNASDDRFSSKATRAWLGVETKDAEKLFGIDCSASSDRWEIGPDGKERMALNILNPRCKDNGNLVRIQVVETTTPTEFEAEEPEKYAKRAGKDGDYILHKGNYIFMHKFVVDIPIEQAESWDEDLMLTADAEETLTQANSGVSADKVEVTAEKPF